MHIDAIGENPVMAVFESGGAVSKHEREEVLVKDDTISWTCRKQEARKKQNIRKHNR